jgi:hypothetical protein
VLLAVRALPTHLASPPCCWLTPRPRRHTHREIGFLSKLNCYWFFCRYFVFAIVTIVALLASPIILWLDPWVWSFATIYFLVSANVAVVVYLYFTIFSYVFLLFSVVSARSCVVVVCGRRAPACLHALCARACATAHAHSSTRALARVRLPQVLGYFKMWAMISGILGLKKSKSWKVTLKFAADGNNSWLRSYHKPYTLELALFAFYALMLGFSIWYENWGLTAYNGVMAFSFLVVSFGDYFL